MDKLSPGRIYRVVKVRPRRIVCPIHEGGGVVAEVVLDDVEAAVDTRVAVEGAVIAFSPQLCEEVECPSRELCQPQGLVEGDRCKILRVGEGISCPMNRSLVKVVLRLLS